MAAIFSPLSPPAGGGGGEDGRTGTWGGKAPSPAAPYRTFPLRFPTAPSPRGPRPAVAGGPFARPRKAQRGSRDTAGGRHFVSWFLGRALCGSGEETGRGGGGAVVPALPHRVALPSRPPPQGALGGGWRSEVVAAGAGARAGPGRPRGASGQATAAPAAGAGGGGTGHRS